MNENKTHTDDANLEEKCFDELLLEVLELPESQQDAFIASASADAEVRRRLREAARTEIEEDFLASPLPTEEVGDLASLLQKVRIEHSGGSVQKIGPYEVVETLGAGGMGQVFLADQTEPIRRRVALKLVRSGRLNEEAILRFSLESRAAALLRHPNIARFLDAGATEEGHPFFVMEYVEGSPITAFCASRRLNVEERIRLFLGVCRGTQHAHLHQILHRDLKPANILVTETDDAPCVKIIDFGIAKALDGSSDGVVQTGDRILGTPAYMSPETLRRSDGEDPPDSRSDVYSIGLVLYRLLVGRTPFGPIKTVMNHALRVCDEDPPAPTRKFADLDERQQRYNAALCGCKPKTLVAELRGDLDHILLKAVARDPAHRYRSAEELALDLERYLKHRPVLARPPSRIYRSRKWARRHPAALFFSIAALFLFVGGWFGLSNGLQEARRQAEEIRTARAEEIEVLRKAEESTDFLIRLFELPDPTNQRVETTATEITARELLIASGRRIRQNDDYAPQTRIRFGRRIGDLLIRLGAYSDAEPWIEEAVRFYADRNDLEEFGESLFSQGILHYYKKENEETESAYRQALAAFEGVSPRRTADVLHNLGVFYYDQQRNEEARVVFERGLRLREQELPKTHPDLAKSLSGLGVLHIRVKEYAEAEAMLLRALEIRERTFGPNHIHVAYNLNSLAFADYSAGNYESAEKRARRALKIWRDAGGEDDPQAMNALQTLAWTFRNQERWEEAETIYLQILQTVERRRGPENFAIAQNLNRLGVLYWRAERYEEMIDPLLRSLDILHKIRSPEVPWIASPQTNLGLALWKSGRLREAESYLRESLAFNEKRREGAVAWSLWGLAGVLRDEGIHLQEAEELYLEALRIRKRDLAPDDPNLLATQADYEELLRIRERDDS